MKPVWNKFIAVAMFAISMAALESAVVVYLRALYYPGEFTVAFRLIDEKVLSVEVMRELATLVMLATIGYLCGRTFREKLAWFLISFAVWDIFYYVWLKVFIDWPSSLLEWDILFLIPFTWLGPVLAPVICSISMLALAAAILHRRRPVPPLVWTFIAAGCTCILYTFLKDYGTLLLTHEFAKDYPNLMQNDEFRRVASTYIPASYSWAIFWLGELLICFAIATHLYSGRAPDDHMVPLPN